jgi:hypothetical protein
MELCTSDADGVCDLYRGLGIMKAKLGATLAVAGCAFGLLLSFALAEEANEPDAFVKEGLKKSDLTRYVPSGKNRTVWFVYAANPDCSSQGDIDIKTTKEPAHGTIEIVPGEGFVSFQSEHYRTKCGGKKLRGVNVNYKSSGGYVGPDEFDVIALYPKGFGWEVHFNMSVR